MSGAKQMATSACMMAQNHKDLPTHIQALEVGALNPPPPPAPAPPTKPYGCGPGCRLPNRPS